MKYLRKFNTEADVMMFDSPNVVLVADSGKVMYNVPKLQGVYIQHINGKLYDEAGWTNGGFSNDEANGVAVITSKASFVIAKTGLTSRRWSSDTSNLVDGVFTTTDATIAKTDFAGYNNTQFMLATDKSGAGYSCANFVFPNGAKGYLPAAGELEEAHLNLSKINSAMTLIGGADVTDYLWSSTQHSSTKSWRTYINYGSASSTAKDYTYNYARPFTTL